MRHLIRILTLSLTLLISLSASARKRVGVVLSGGGAKGTAHIGALRVIEEAGIPIDVIVGTSMGSIVGGLYSIGFTPDELDSLFMSQDWITLLRDRDAPQDLSLSKKEENSQYLLSVPFFEKPQDVINSGVIRGRNIGKMLWATTEGYHDSIDFRKLPIPFACVAQDLVSGREIVMQSGVLPIAIRSSMSLPAVFAPMAVKQMLLIDGGLVNNYPVDIAREMGADIVIGVDVQDPLKDEKQLANDLIGQMGQLISLQGQDRWKENVKNTDVYIKVNVDGYNSASFNLAAIDTLIERGTQATMAKIDTLRLIAKEVNPKREMAQRPTPQYFNSREQPNDIQKTYLDILIGEKPQNSINLGFRFDNEELAALLFNTQIRFGQNQTHGVGVTARLGKKTYGRLEYVLHMGKLWYFSAGYQLTYNDFNVYEKGQRSCEINFVSHQTGFNFSRSWKKLILKFSGTFHHYDYSSLLFSTNNSIPRNIDKETYLRFGVEGTANNLNSPYFPTKGSELNVGYHYILPLNNQSMFHTAFIHWKAAFPFNSHLTAITRIDARYITSDHTISEINTYGGQEPGKYFSQQLPLYGINHFEIGQRMLTIAGVELRQRIGKKHYVSGIFNIGLTSNDWKRFFPNSFGNNEQDGYHILGGAIKYDMQTFMGPFGFSLHFSNRDKVSGYFRAGFNF